MRLKELSEMTYGSSAPWLVELAKKVRAEVAEKDSTVLRGDFHAAAVHSGGEDDTGDTYVETTRWRDGAEKDPAIIRAISEMAKHGDRNVLLAVAYGGEPGKKPHVHAPCESCMRKLLAFDSDHSCDIVVEKKSGKLMLLSLREYLAELDARIERDGGKTDREDLHAQLLKELQIS